MVGRVADAYGSATFRNVAVDLVAAEYELVKARDDFELAQSVQDPAMLCRTISGLAVAGTTRRALQVFNDSTNALLSDMLVELHTVVTTHRPEVVLTDSALHFQALRDIANTLNATSDEQEMLFGIFQAVAMSAQGQEPSHETMFADAMHVAEELGAFNTHNSYTRVEPSIVQLVFSVLRGQLVGTSVETVRVDSAESILVAIAI